jgi:vacuolar-type H+-ATPase subunit I/STV1
MKAILQLAVFVLLSTLTLEAQRKGSGKRGLKGDRAIASREFDSVRGEFDAWKEATLHAGSLVARDDGRLHEMAKSFYQAMSQAFELERLSDEGFAELGVEYIRLVRDGSQLEIAAFDEKLSALARQAKERADGVINAATATLQVNRQQAKAREYLWFGMATGKLSNGKRATIERKLKSLQALEAKAKSDQRVDEREREKLEEEVNEIVIELMEALAS